jgi:hypothetical protein
VPFSHATNKDAVLDKVCVLFTSRFGMTPSFLDVVLLIAPYQLANACTPYIGDEQLSRTSRPEARGAERSQTAKPIFLESSHDRPNRSCVSDFPRDVGDGMKSLAEIVRVSAVQYCTTQARGSVGWRPLSGHIQDAFVVRVVLLVLHA